MIKETTHRQQPNRERAQQQVDVMDSLTTTVRTDYWVVDEHGRLADPDRVAGLPGADRTDSPYSVAVETPPCETCGELRRALVDRLRSTVAAAHDRNCRLVALGMRPDLLVDEPSPSAAGEPPPIATAGTRVVFEPPAAAAADCYNTLSALDPAFVLINTASRVDGDQHYACGRPSLIHGGPAGRYRIADEAATDNRSAADDEPTAGGADDDRQPVAWLDGGSKIEWRSLDATTPTLLVDMVADVTEVLQQAVRCRLRIASFGNGFHGDRLVLPTNEWRAIYTDAAIQKGVSSLLVRAYLERFGIETGWYRAAIQPVDAPVPAAELPALCRERAAGLEADLGLPAVA